MARVLEAKRVLVQESDERTLSPRPRPSCSTKDPGSTGTAGQGSPGSGAGNERGRRRALQSLDAHQQQSTVAGPALPSRPDSPTSIAARFGDIFGRDVQEDEVVSTISCRSAHACRA